MNLVNKLNDEELNMILRYINAYALEEDSPMVYLDDVKDNLLNEWAENKENLYHLFDDNFIIKKTINYSSSIKDLEKNVENTILKKVKNNDCYYDYTFMNEYSELIRYYYNYAHEIYGENFDEYREKSRVASGLTKLNTSLALAENKFTNSSNIEIKPFGKYDFKPFVISTGCKVSKALGKIANAFNLKGFEEFRIAHSMCLNKKEMHGELCLSIHPLDYMTMSDNDSDWSSCMSWKEHGCYRQGTVEMMNSPKVIVAYLTAENEMDLIDYDVSNSSNKWNNKKWRELFIVDDNAIFNVKGYPYKSVELETIVISWIKELKENKEDIKYTDIEDFNPFVSCASKNLGKNIKIRPETLYMYNDFSADNIHHVIYNLNLKNNSTLSITYSGATQCMCCGAKDEKNCDFIASEEFLVCEKCGGYSEEDCVCCCSCGEEMYADDGYYVDDEWYCGNCYDEYCGLDICGSEHVIDKCKKVYLSFDGEKYNKDIFAYIYKYDNIEDFINAKYFTVSPHKIILPNGANAKNMYIKIDELDFRGINYFKNQYGNRIFDDDFNDKYADSLRKCDKREDEE